MNVCFCIKVCRDQITFTWSCEKTFELHFGQFSRNALQQVCIPVDPAIYFNGRKNADNIVSDHEVTDKLKKINQKYV